MIMLAAAAQESGDRKGTSSALQRLGGPDVPGLIFLLGRTCVQANDLAGARVQLRKLEQAAPKSATLNSHVYMLLSQIALAEKRTQVAVSDAELAVRYQNSTLAEEMLAEAHESNRQYAEAIRDFESVLSRSNERQLDNPDWPAFHEVVRVHYRLGVLYQMTGQKQQAKQHLQSFLSNWANADDSLTVYRDAKRRYSALN
jgi:tetratricopeptide (TPR) repeat protein